MRVSIVAYTTLYREGGPKFATAARTLVDELTARGEVVECRAVESKRELVSWFEDLAARGDRVGALHFIGHSGMYGPMFRTTAMPEQFSPHEWRTLSIPFDDDADAYFHCCRSARWFAPFFARTQRVRAHGYHLYTTFSARPDRFVYTRRTTGPLYVVAVPGKKSHGPLASVAKYAGWSSLERMKTFEPEGEVDRSYDPVASLYDRVFDDISVRADEVRYIEERVPLGSRVLEIGCGNGALLAYLDPRIASGVGVDASAALVALAREKHGARTRLRFEAIAGPTLPVADGSVDVVISMLSFRYLDWDPVMAEIRRVLAPGGRLIVVDMVALPMRLRDIPLVARTKVAEWRTKRARPAYREALAALVGDARWRKMLEHNPIRAEHEIRWYLESRFPGRRLEVLTASYAARVVAFDSGPLAPGATQPQSYP